MTIVATTLQDRLDYNMGYLLRGLRESAAAYEESDPKWAVFCQRMAQVLALEGWEGLDAVVEALSRMSNPQVGPLLEDMRKLRHYVLWAEART